MDVSGVSPLLTFASDEDELLGVLVPDPTGNDRKRGPRRLAGIAGCGGIRPTRVPRGGRGRYDLGDHARLPPLGVRYLISDQGADESPVVGLELAVVDPAQKLAEFVQRDLQPLRPRAGFPTRLP